MTTKFRHFRNAAKRYGVTIAWTIDSAVIPKEQERFGAYFNVQVGIAFHNCVADEFSRSEGRELATYRLNNEHFHIRLYSDETIDHAIFREIRNLNEESALSCKIPRDFYRDLLDMEDKRCPFENNAFKRTSCRNHIHVSNRKETVFSIDEGFKKVVRESCGTAAVESNNKDLIMKEVSKKLGNDKKVMRKAFYVLKELYPNMTSNRRRK